MLQYTFVLPEQYVRVIEAALSEMPYKLSAPVIAVMRAQLAESTAAQNEAMKALNDAANAPTPPAPDAAPSE